MYPPCNKVLVITLVRFVQRVGVLPLREKEHTCSLKIICLNLERAKRDYYS